MKENILDKSNLLKSFKQIEATLIPCFLHTGARFHKIVFTGSVVLEWLKVIDREARDLDIIIYVNKENLTEGNNLEIIDAITGEFFNRYVNYEDVEEINPSANEILEKGYDKTDLISLRIKNLKIDFIFKAIEEYNEEKIINLDSTLISTIDDIFAYKCKFDKKGSKFWKDYFNFSGKIDNSIENMFSRKKGNEEEKKGYKND